MKYEGMVIRPPSEANSMIFQVTIGCSDNKCIFCPAYKDKRFRIRGINEIESDIREASEISPDTRRFFLADGDALAMNVPDLVLVLGMIKIYFPKFSRIGVYGSAGTVLSKTVEELKILRDCGLKIVYIGLETGDESIYSWTRKSYNPIKNAEAVLRLKEAGIKTNVTVILGLGGKDKFRTNALNTAKVLNYAKPDQIAALTLVIAPGTELYNMAQRGEFRPADKFTLLEELRIIVSGLSVFNCLFFSNHASNYFSIDARLPRDKNFVLGELEEVIKRKDESKLTPECFRGL